MGPAKQSILEFVTAVTDRDSPDFVPELDRVAVFDNDGTLWTEHPCTPNWHLRWIGPPSWESHQPEELQAGGMEALTNSSAHPRGHHHRRVRRRVPQLDGGGAAPALWPSLPADRVPADAGAARLLDANGFSCWIFSGGGTDFMRADPRTSSACRRTGSSAASERPSSGSATAGPELVKNAAIQIVNDGPGKPSSIHQHVGQRPIMAAGNTDGDLAMLQWTAASPHRTLQLVVRHTDDRARVRLRQRPDPESGTGQILAAAAEHGWTVIDMATDWSTVHPTDPAA